jgi:hypothetical protein
LGLTIPGVEKKIDVKFKPAQYNDLRKIGKNYIYMKIDKTFRSIYPHVHSYKELPNFNELKIDDLNNDYTYILKKIEKFSKFDDNWDGYNSKKFNIEIIKKSSDFAKIILIFMEEFKLCKKIPFVVPVTDAIQFEWEIGEKYLEIQIRENSYQIFESNIIKGIEKEYFVHNSYDALNSIFKMLKNSDL